MQIENPEAMIWFLALLPCVLVAIGYAIWKRRLMRQLGHAPMIAAMTYEVSNIRQVASVIMTLFGLVLLMIALIQPQWGQTDRLVKRSGIDVVFALDLSRSMLARDVSPSRLDAAKKEISTTLEQLAGDRAGLVVFTSVSFAQSPLTNDYGALRFYLRKLDPRQMPFGGTSLGRAISDGVDLLVGQQPDGENDKKVKRAKNQIIVLITDGEDHESDPFAAARQANAENIHIVTVGFGSTKGERIPTFNDDGTISGFKRNRKGEVVYSRLDDRTLEKLARETQGIYIPYEGENSVAYALIDYINALEKSELEAMMKERYEERFFLFLAPGLLLVLLGFLLGDRRRPGRRRVGKGGEGPSTRHLLTASLALLVILPFGAGCEEVLVREVKLVKKGNGLIEKGKSAEALVAYQEASATLPPSPELSFNTGRAQMDLPEELGSAQEAFARALETDDPHLRFDAFYNLGLVLATQQKWKDAYETFQQALLTYANNPDWRTQPKYLDAIHNMEIAWQKLFPPCSTLEDDMEENDSPETATALQEMKAEGRVMCGGDDDFYVIPVVPGTRLTVRATFEDLRDVLDPERPFLPQPADVQIALFDRAGKQVLVVDQGARPDGDVSAEVTTFTSEKGKRSRVKRELLDFVVTREMLTPGAAEVLLKVKASDEREFSYDFEIEAIPPCVALDDEFESNESRADAKALPEEPQQLHICPGNEDWFSIDLEQGETLFLDLQAGEDLERKAPTQASFEIVDARGKVLATGTPDAGFLTAALWEVEQAGTYYVRVFHPEADAQGPYQLMRYVYGACPESDDRFEENDDAQSAAAIEPQQPVLRYVRVCDDDLDFYTLSLPEPEKKDDQDKKGATTPPMPNNQNNQAPEPRQLSVSMIPIYRDGVPPVIESVPVDELPADEQVEVLPEQELSFVLMDPSGNRVLLDSSPVEELDAPDDDTQVDKKTQKDDQEPNPLAYARILSREIPAEQVLLRVKGPATFYHLVQNNPSSGEGQDEENQDESEGDDSESGDDQKDPSQDESDDGEDGENQDESEGKDGEDGEQEEKDESDPEGEEDTPEPPEQSEDESEKDGTAPTPAQDAEMQRVEDILRALEDSDDNFQMRKALENTPGRYIEKDW